MMRWSLFLVSSALAAGKDGPVQKVVKLLKDMQKQIETESEQDKKVYDEMVCWCSTNKQEKEDAIAENEALIPELEATIAELNAKFGQLFQEVDEHKKSIEESQTSLNNATAVREKEAAEFQTMKAEQTEAVSQLGAAINVLEKLHGDAFLQGESVNNIKNVLGVIQKKFSTMVDREDLKTAFSLLEARPYENQSGEIFGFLKSMKDSMSANFAEAEAAEKEAAASFKEMKAAKEEQIAAEKKMLVEKQKASTEARLTSERTKKQLAQAQEQLAEDREFLAELIKRCKANDDEMAARMKDRAIEIKAIGEAMGVLQSDEMRDITFTQTLLKKTNAAKKAIQMDKAIRVLQKAGARANNPEISFLATVAQLDGIKKVQEKIDAMIADIKKQKQDEVTGAFGRDWCVKELNDTEVKTKETEYAKEDLIATQEEKESQIKKLTAIIKNLQVEIANMKTEVQKASEERVDSSKEFQVLYKEQETIVALLNKAKEKLEAVYSKTAFLQTRGKSSQEQPDIGAPQGLAAGGYKKNSSGGGVMGMIEEIVQDAYKVQTDAFTEEQDQITAYGEFAKDSFAGIEERSRAVVSNTSSKADAEQTLEETKAEIMETVNQLGLLNKHEIEVHTKCDFLLKNFEVRQQAMGEEIEALQQAKQILSGMQ